MGYKDDKSLSFDKFKERVYGNIGMVESLDEVNSIEGEILSNTGCFGVLISPFFINFGKYAKKKARTQMGFRELRLKADEILAQPEIKELICANLDATVTLPIEAAYKLTPVLYELARKDEEKVPLDSILFAIICRKITDQGVQKYCPPKETKKRERKSPLKQQ